MVSIRGNEYYVFSLYNVAYIMNQGIPVLKIDEVDGKLAFFFEDSEKLREVIKQMKVDKEFFNYIDSYKAAKQMLADRKYN
jgi:hypothetical protein